MYEGDLDNTLPFGCLDAYLKRGWCRLEVVAALCPKRLGASRAWRPGRRLPGHFPSYFLIKK